MPMEEVQLAQVQAFYSCSHVVSGPEDGFTAAGKKSDLSQTVIGNAFFFTLPFVGLVYVHKLQQLPLRVMIKQGTTSRYLWYDKKKNPIFSSLSCTCRFKL